MGGEHWFGLKPSLYLSRSQAKRKMRIQLPEFLAVETILQLSGPILENKLPEGKK